MSNKPDTEHIRENCTEFMAAIKNLSFADTKDPWKVWQAAIASVQPEIDRLHAELAEVKAQRDRLTEQRDILMRELSHAEEIMCDKYDNVARRYHLIIAEFEAEMESTKDKI